MNSSFLNLHYPSKISAKPKESIPKIQAKRQHATTNILPVSSDLNQFNMSKDMPQSSRLNSHPEVTGPKKSLWIKNSVLQEYSTRNYLDFQCQANEALHWGKMNYWNWYSSLSSEQKLVISEYTNMSFAFINGFLRKNRSVSPTHTAEIQTLIRNLSSLLRTTHIPENIVVYRGIKKRTLPILLGTDALELPINSTLTEWNALLQGRIIKEIGFMSSSLIKSVATNYSDAKEHIRLKIHIPKGTHGAYVEELSYFNSEHEVIFDRNQYLLIQSVSCQQEHLYPMIEIQCQLINQNDCVIKSHT